MATLKEKKLAKAIVANSTSINPLNKKQLLVSAGYDETTASATPSRVIDQKGVQEELEILGFNETNAKTVVSEIMMNDEADSGHRLKAADMVFKTFGTYAPERRVNLNIDGDLTRREEELRDSLRELLD